MNELKFTLTVDEANLILEALGEQPFSKVYALIGKIQQQAGAQLSENPSTEENSIGTKGGSKPIVSRLT